MSFLDVYFENVV